MPYLPDPAEFPQAFAEHLQRFPFASTIMNSVYLTLSRYYIRADRSNPEQFCVFDRYANPGRDTIIFFGSYEECDREVAYLTLPRSTPSIPPPDSYDPSFYD
jgi:hypothetical protein